MSPHLYWHLVGCHSLLKLKGSSNVWTRLLSSHHAKKKEKKSSSSTALYTSWTSKTSLCTNSMTNIQPNTTTAVRKHILGLLKTIYHNELWHQVKVAHYKYTTTLHSHFRANTVTEQLPVNI